MIPGEEVLYVNLFREPRHGMKEEYKRRHADVLEKPTTFGVTTRMGLPTSDCCWKASVCDLSQLPGIQNVRSCDSHSLLNTPWLPNGARDDSLKKQRRILWKQVTLSPVVKEKRYFAH